MNTFFFIFSYTIKRFLKDIREISILLIIPVGLIVINSMFGDPVVLYGYNVTSSMNMPIFVLSFQFFNMGIMLYTLYLDFKGNMRWRLRATPHSLLALILPAFVASWLFSLFLGLVIILVSLLFLGAYLGNILVLATVLLLVSLMSSFLAMLIFLFAKTYALANAVVYIVSFGLMIISGYMFPLGGSPLAVFLRNFGTPLSLGSRAIIYSGSLNEILHSGEGGRGMEQSLTNIGILAAITLILAIFTLFAARRRKI